MQQRLPLKQELLLLFATFQVRKFSKRFKGKCDNCTGVFLLVQPIFWCCSQKSVDRQVHAIISDIQKTAAKNSCLNCKRVHREIRLNDLFLSKLRAACQNSTQKEFLRNIFSTNLTAPLCL